VAFPIHRMRRLRSSEALRNLVRETVLDPGDFILPLFICPGEGLRREIKSMPGHAQLSVDRLVAECGEAHALGIGGVILFGIPETKDELASGAYADDGIVQQAVRALKREVPKLLVMLFEDDVPSHRQVFLDGRAHPKDPNPSWMGHSIGHWDGDTLVVDTIGLNDETWLAGSFSAPKYTNIHSDKEHVIERWTRDGDTLTYQATVEDPVMFTHPWVQKPRRIKHAGPDPTNENALMQFNCVPTDLGHIIKPTKTDKYICNYCDPDKFKDKATTTTGASTTKSKSATPASGSTTKN